MREPKPWCAARVVRGGDVWVVDRAGCPKKRYLREADHWVLFLIIFPLGSLDPQMGGKKKQTATPPQ